MYIIRMNTETGKISEYVENTIGLNISTLENESNGFTLRIKTCKTDPDILVIHHKNQNYSCSHKQAYKHILDAIDLACLSVYKSPHWIQITIPFYPTLSIPLTKYQECKTTLISALENYLNIQ